MYLHFDTPEENNATEKASIYQAYPCGTVTAISEQPEVNFSQMIFKFSKQCSSQMQSFEPSLIYSEFNRL